MYRKKWCTPFSLLYFFMRHFPWSLDRPKQKWCAKITPTGSWCTNFRVQGSQNYWCFIIYSHIRLHNILRHGVGLFYHCIPWLHFPNCLSSVPNGDRMKKLRPQEVGIEIYHFEDHKIIGVLYYMVMLSVYYIQCHSVAHFHYCTPAQYLSNYLSSNPNEDRMQTLCPCKVGIPTYHFRFPTLLAFNLKASCLG